MGDPDASQSATALTGATDAERVIGRYGSDGPGATLIVVAGVHGNEPAGAEAARRVLDRLAASTPAGFEGSLIALAGNLSAIHHAGGPVRYLERDLNRIMTPEDLNAPPATPDHAQAQGLARALECLCEEASGPVYVLDLHTVSSASPPFGAMSDSLPARAFARHFPIPFVLGFEEHVGGLVIDWATTELGCVSVIVESGQHDDPASVGVHEATIWTGLHAAGILSIQSGSNGDGVSHRTDPREVLSRAAGARARAVFDIRHREPIACDDFEIQQGCRAYEPVRRRRDVIAHSRGRAITSPVSGLLFMPNRQPVRRPGDDGYYVVVEVGRGWLKLSAWLRTRPWVHRALPRVLPGVRRRAGDPHALVVAPEIAAVLKRQLFHLLGYRLERWSPVREVTGVRRVFAGLSAFAGSLAKMAAGVFRGGERGALPAERREDWVVARRMLDRALHEASRETGRPVDPGAGDPGTPTGA